MVLTWKDPGGYQRHLETMKVFRQSHGSFPPNGQPPGDIPGAFRAGLIISAGRVTCLAGPRVNAIVPPIWKIAMPPGSQN